MKSWKEEFDKKFKDYPVAISKIQAYDFISNLLDQKERDTIQKIEQSEELRNPMFGSVRIYLQELLSQSNQEKK